MEIISVDNRNPQFTLPGTEEKMSMEILKVVIQEPVNRNLSLEVTDENGFVLYTKPLIPLPKHPNAVLDSNDPEIPVNKRFIYSASLTIRIEAPAGSYFSAEIYTV